MGISSFSRQEVEVVPTDSNKNATPMNLSFCGCGLLGIYHLGVANALCLHGAKFLQNVHCYVGASAGTLVASILAIHGPKINVIKVSFQYSQKQLKSFLQKSDYQLLPENLFFLHIKGLQIKLAPLEI